MKPLDSLYEEWNYYQPQHECCELYHTRTASHYVEFKYRDTQSGDLFEEYRFLCPDCDRNKHLPGPTFERYKELYWRIIRKLERRAFMLNISRRMTRKIRIRAMRRGFEEG